MAEYFCMDFESNRYEARSGKNKLFSAGLENQYRNLRESKDFDYEDFVRTLIIKPMKINFSYPNFVRNFSPQNDGGDRFYNNVAVRIPRTGDDDLVFLGDIFEKGRNGHRQFIVKSIQTMNADIRHHGEVSREGLIVVRLEGSWEDLEGINKHPSVQHVEKSVLTNNLMVELNYKYPVTNRKEVMKTLDEWSSFVDTRKRIIDKDSREGYDLKDVPVIFKAYHVDGKLPAGIEPLQHLSNGAWTLSDVEGSRAAAIMHLHMDFLSEEFNGCEKRRSPKALLDGFTRGPLALVDPSVSDKNGRPKQLVIMRDCRIAVSSKEEIPPKEEIDGINVMREAEKKKAHSDMVKAIDRDVERELDEFKAGALEEMVLDHIESQRGIVTRAREVEISEMTNKIQREMHELSVNLDSMNAEKMRIEKELETARDEFEAAESIRKAISNRKEEDEDSKIAKEDLKTAKKESDKAKKRFSDIEAELKKIDKGISGAESQYTAADKKLKEIPSIEDVVDADLRGLADSFRQRTVDAEKATIRDRLTPIHSEDHDSRCRQIDFNCDEKIEVAVRDRTTVRLHLYFEPEMPDAQSVDSFVQELGNRMRPGMRLCKDFTGDRAILDRQFTALENLRNGYVMNPFIATALFEPEITGSDISPKGANIDAFYQYHLNAVQKEAVRRACSSRGMFLIQGPPGTGKTQVIAEITTQIALSGRKVLIASENNKAVDNAFSRLLKIPAIRPMRIVRKDRRKVSEATPYAPEDLLKNFYTSISTSLDEEISRYDSTSRYLSDLNADIEELSSMNNRIQDRRRAVESIQDRIVELEDERQRAIAKMEEADSKNNQIDEDLDELNGMIEDIERLQDDDLLREATRIAAGEGIEGLPTDDHRVRELLTMIIRCSTDDVWDEVDRIEDHGEYVEKLLSKSSAPKGTIPAINRELGEYEDQHNIDRTRDFPLLNALGCKFDGNIVIAVKDRLRNLIEERTKDLHDKVARKKRRRTKVSGEVADRCMADIERLRADSAYTMYEGAMTQFNKKALEVLNRIHMQTGSKDPDDIIELIKIESDRIRHESNDSSLKDRMAVYRKIVGKLREEAVIEADADRYNPELMKTVNVIGMTCTAGDRFEALDEERINLSDLNVDVVIIDEVSKIPFVEILQPILYGKTVILVGDHKQLAPMYTSIVDKDEFERYEGIITPDQDERFREIYTRSFFEDLFERSPESNKITLTTQYRMHPNIMDVDNVFYGRKLEFGGMPESKAHRLSIKGANGSTVIGPEDHVVFIDCKGHEIQESGSTSFRNNLEAKVVEKLLSDMDSACRYDREGEKLRAEYSRYEDERLSAGVICAYADQARLIRNGNAKRRFQSFNAMPDDRFMVKTVDDFQGDERDIIVLSLVRTKKSQFLADYHRINVAVSRARRLLVIVGNREALEKINVEIDGSNSPVYKNMIKQIQRCGKLLTSADILGGE